MTVEQLKAKIYDILGEYIEDVELTGDMNLVEDIGLSSLQIMSVLGEFEEEFGIDIPVSSLSEMETVDNLIEFVIESLS